jgi:hypothetical protein
MLGAINLLRLSAISMRHIALAGALLALVPATPCWAISGLTIDDPQLLHDIERSGFSFGELVVGAAAAAADNAALYRQASYRGIVANLAADLESLRATDSLLGTTIKARHRLLDARWLMSASARFELVGVVNRMDRAPFAPGTCGEVRFIYRLAYRKDEPSGSVYSRLPMTVNVVFVLRGMPSGAGRSRKSGRPSMI